MRECFIDSTISCGARTVTTLGEGRYVGKNVVVEINVEDASCVVL